jgi:hypothetical protein
MQQNERRSCRRPTGNDVCRPKLRGNTQALIRYIPECENFIVGSVVRSFAFWRLEQGCACSSQCHPSFSGAKRRLANVKSGNSSPSAFCSAR